MNQEISQPPSKNKNGLKKVLNLLLIVGIIAAVSLFLWAELDRRSTADELESTRAELERIRQSTERDADEVARQVLERVRRLMDIPAEPEPTVATIIDIDSLQEANEFYRVAQNGDHLIITEQRAILYSPDRDIILDVVPVVIDETLEEEQAESPAGGTETTPANNLETPEEEDTE